MAFKMVFVLLATSAAVCLSEPNIKKGVNVCFLFLWEILIPRNIFLLLDRGEGGGPDPWYFNWHTVPIINITSLEIFPSEKLWYFRNSRLVPVIFYVHCKSFLFAPFYNLKCSSRVFWNFQTRMRKQGTLVWMRFACVNHNNARIFLFKKIAGKKVAADERNLGRLVFSLHILSFFVTVMFFNTCSPWRGIEEKSGGSWKEPR